MTTLADDEKNPEGVTVAAASAESAEVIRVLHIDDEEQQQMFLKVFVEGDPSIKVTSVLCAKDVFDLVETGAYDCIVSDYDMQDMDGITLARKVRQTSQIPIIIYTGRGSEEVAERAFEAGIDDYIRKEMSPAHYQVLSKRIRQAVERRRSNESYKNLFDNANDSIILHTLDGKILDINEAGCRKLGYSKEELLGKIFYDHATPNGISNKDLFNKIIKQGHAVFESTIKSRDGSLIPVEVSNKVIKYMGVDAVLSFNRDITERKRRQRDLVRLATFPQLNPNPIVEADLSGKIYYTNPAAALKFPELTRARSMASLGLDWGEIVAQLQGTDDGKLFRDAKIDGVWYALSVDIVPGSDRMRLYATDIDERVRGEESLRHSEESYRDLFEDASDAISIVAFDGHIVDVNEVGCRTLGYSKEEIRGMTISQYVASPGFDFNDYLEKITRKGHAIFEATHVARDGRLIPVEVNAKIIKHEGVDVILSFSRDISDRKRLESQMKERLEALQSHALELSRCEDVTAVAKTTYKILKETMDYHFFGLGLVKDNTLSFIPEVITDSDWVKDYPFDTPSVCVRAAKMRSAIVVPDVRLEPDYIGPKTSYKYLSEVVVPIKIGDKVVGVINVEDEKVNRFTRDDAMLLEVFSEHVASAINRIELLEKTRRYVARIDAMNRHTARLAKLNTVKEVADFSMDVIQDLLGFGDGCIGVVEGDTIKFKFARNLTFPIPNIPVSGRGITARAVRTGESQLVLDTRLDPDFVKDVDSAEYLSELDVPVKIDDRVVAVINLEDQKPGFFSEEDREVVETLAVRFGSSMRRIGLLESVRQYRANLEVLHRHAQSLANIGSVKEVAVHTFKIIRDLLGFTMGAFGVVEADNLRFIYTNPIPVERFPLMPLSGGGVTVRAVKTGESQLVPDVRLDSGFVNYIDSLSLLSELAVPVSIDGRVIAVINLEKDSLNAFTEEDRRILEVLAEHVASAISRIEQLRVIRESKDDLLALHNHAHVLNELMNIEEVAKATLKILHTHLKCNLLSMRTSDGKKLTMLARWGAKPIKKPLPIKGKGLMAKAAREKQALLVNDTRADPDFTKGNNHTLSELVVPILFREELLGVLNAESPELNAFSDNEEILMEALADEVGSTIVRIRSLENERIYNLKLKALNISSIKSTRPRQSTINLISPAR